MLTHRRRFRDENLSKGGEQKVVKEKGRNSLYAKKCEEATRTPPLKRLTTIRTYHHTSSSKGGTHARHVI